MVVFGTRDEYHQKKGKGMIGKNKCPFCNLKEQGDYIIWKGKYWFIIYNRYPYTGNNQHIMAIPYSHKKIFTDLNNKEILELKEVNNFIKGFFGDNSYFSFLRETLHQRSIEHLHYHFIAGMLKGKYVRKMLMDQGFPIVEKLD